MPDQPVSQLTEDTAPGLDDLLYTVNDPSGSPASRKATIANFLKTNRHVIDAKDYGAKGDGATNDDAAVALAVAAVPDGGALYFPSGTYVLTAAISFSSKTVTIVGDGPGVSILQFTGSNGIGVTLGTDARCATIRDLSLTTGSAGTYVAITVTGFDVSTSTQHHLTIDNVWIRPKTDASHYWAEGILLSEVWNGTVSNCLIRGNDTYSSATNGIRLTAECVDVHIVNCKILHFANGIKLDDNTPTTQGVRVHECFLGAVGTGISHNTPTNGGLAFEMVGGHINAYDYGIRLSKVPQSLISGVLIYKTGGNNFIGIELTNSANTRVVGAMVRGSGAGTETGINLKTGCTECSVVGCSINDQGTGILLDSGANLNAIIGNTGSGTSTDITDNGSGNTIEANQLPDTFRNGAGSAFPAGPLTGDRFFRTDLGLPCYYDGTRWLTITEYDLNIPILTTGVDAGTALARVRLDYALYVTRVAISTFVATTNDASNYWTLTVRGVNSARSATTTILTFTTASDAADAYVDHDAAPSTANPSNKTGVDVYAAKTLSPGSVSVWTTVYYRIIIT